MMRSSGAWDARVDAALALLIGSVVVGVLAYAGIIGSAAGSPGNAAYALLALSLTTFAWAAIRHGVRRA